MNVPSALTVPKAIRSKLDVLQKAFDGRIPRGVVRSLQFVTCMDSFQEDNERDIPLIYLEGDTYVSRDFSRYFAGPSPTGPPLRQAILPSPKIPLLTLSVTPSPLSPSFRFP